MSLFEWWGESRNPGSVGGIDVADHSRRRKPHVGWTLVKFGLAFASCIAAPLLVATQVPEADLKLVGGAFMGFITYIALSTMFTPRPDMSNLGFAGGLIDHPFRYSDDLNRSLLGLLILCAPGRFLGSGVVDMYHLIAGD